MPYEKQPDVLPLYTRNEVWQAIINGATAIGYFTHAWRPEFKEFAPTPEMQKELLEKIRNGGASEESVDEEIGTEFDVK